MFFALLRSVQRNNAALFGIPGLLHALHNLLPRARPLEEKPLCKIAVVCSNKLALRFGFDTFGGYFQPQGASQSRDRFDDALIVRIARNVFDERLIDLMASTGSRLMYPSEL